MIFKKNKISLKPHLNIFIDVSGVPDQDQKGSWHKTNCSKGAFRFVIGSPDRHLAAVSGGGGGGRSLGLRLLETEKIFLLKNFRR